MMTILVPVISNGDFIPIPTHLSAIVTSLSLSPCTQICPGLPKTRSGKIMRRILRKIAADKPDELGDISTLADPSVVQTIVEIHGQNRRG